eukprot:1849873-Amphidinium_carterae.1
MNMTCIKPNNIMTDCLLNVLAELVNDLIAWITSGSQAALEAKRAAGAGRLGLDWPRALAVRNPLLPKCTTDILYLIKAGVSHVDTDTRKSAAWQDVLPDTSSLCQILEDADIDHELGVPFDDGRASKEQGEANDVEELEEKDEEEEQQDEQPEPPATAPASSQPLALENANRLSRGLALKLVHGTLAKRDFDTAASCKGW